MPDRDPLSGEYAVLALLRVQPMHGYEMAQSFAGAHLAEVCPIESGLLYTYLRNLEARGLIAWTEMRVGRRPPRKLYDLSEAGRSLIDSWLQQPVYRMREVRRDLLVKLYVLHLIAPDAERDLVDRQLAACRNYLNALPEPPAADTFLRLVIESKRAAARGTLGWLESYARELSAGVLSV